MKYTKLPKYTKQTCDVEAAARARPEAPERDTVHTGAPGALNLGEATMGRPEGRSQPFGLSLPHAAAEEKL